MQTRRRIACRRATNAGRAGTCEHKYLATQADIRIFSGKSVVELGPYLSQNSPSFGRLEKLLLHTVDDTGQVQVHSLFPFSIPSAQVG